VSDGMSERYENMETGIFGQNDSIGFKEIEQTSIFQASYKILSSRILRSIYYFLFMHEDSCRIRFQPFCEVVKIFTVY
jgi:hypothetical protein